MKSFRIVVIGCFRSKLYQLKCSSVQCRHCNPTKIIYYHHCINASTGTLRTCWKTKFHQLFMVCPKILLHSLNRCYLKQLITVYQTYTFNRYWPTFFVHTMEIEWITTLHLLLLTKYKILYYCLYLVLLSPIYVIVKHQFNVGYHELARTAEPK